MRLPLFVAFCAVVTLSGCVTPPPTPPPKPVVVKTALPVKKASFWKGDEVKGESRIVIDLSGQRVYFYKGDALVGESVVSSGKKGFETPPGKYKVIQKDKDHASTLYGQFVGETTWICRRTSRPPAQSSKARRCHFSSAFTMDTACMPGSFRDIAHRMDAFGCRGKWRCTFSTMRRLALR